jgi:organic hydroperoxide reductase OsmC/OhrA
MPGGGNGVASSALTVRAQAPDGDAAKLKTLAEDAKENCPISKALKGNVALSVEATPS